MDLLERALRLVDAANALTAETYRVCRLNAKPKPAPDPVPVPADRLYTTAEAAEMAGVSIRTVYRARKAGLLHPVVATGGAYRYTPEMVKQLRDMRQATA